MIHKKKDLWELAIVFFSVIGFLAFKFSHLSFHFGDGNAYIYMAQAFSSGHWPYRDFFLADPPFFVLLLVPLKMIFGNHLLLFQAMSPLIEAGTALLLYLILRGKKSPLAFLAPAIYLFSFTVLAISDFFTGVQLVVFFIVLGVYLWQKHYPFLSGLVWALACLIKLYAGPAFLGLLILSLASKQQKAFFKMALGAAVGVALVLLPFAIFALPQMVNFTLLHQFHRPPGLNQAAVWQFLWHKQWLLLLLALFGGMTKKDLLIIYPLLFSLLFLLLFQDLYYNYFLILMPFLSLLVVQFFSWAWEKFRYGRQMALGLLAVFILFAVAGFVDYQNNFIILSRFLNAPQVAAAVKALPKNYPLYGSHEVAPLVALMSGKPIFANIIDTNTQAFASGGQNLAEISRQAVATGVYLLAKITDLPQYGIKDFGFEGYFEKSVFEKSCGRVLQFPSTSGEQDNVIAVYECKK
jgi:hypothetical protein